MNKRPCVFDKLSYEKPSCENCPIDDFCKAEKEDDEAVRKMLSDCVDLRGVVKTIISEENREVLKNVCISLEERFNNNHKPGEYGEMFDFNVVGYDSDTYSYEITLLGGKIFESSGLYDNFVQPTEKNQRKLDMLCTAAAVNRFDAILTNLAFSNASIQNKTKWQNIFKKGLENETNKQNGTL